MNIRNTLPRPRVHWALKAALALLMALALAACGGSGGGGSDPLRAYENGYADGFAQDGEYFLGYDESWFTEGAFPILYSGHLIPFIDELSYDAGFFDGEFDAYNDGYFVAYRYAFIIGFSEGYDNAFWSDYLDFLANDFHSEFHNGGFDDGYNDGFSEGRVFGAFDYEAFFVFDWLDAFLDWESGTDLYFEEVDVGTGEFGPVTLYEYALNPHILRDGGDQRASTARQAIAMRDTKVTKGSSGIDFSRPLNSGQTEQLDTTPLESQRNDRELAITQSWLERIQAFEASATREARQSRADSNRAR